MKTTLYCSVYVVLIGHCANGLRTIWACRNKQLFREDKAAGNHSEKKCDGRDSWSWNTDRDVTDMFWITDVEAIGM